MAPPSRRLAVFVPSMRGGGAERTMLSLAQGFERRGHDVDLVLVRAHGPLMERVDDRVNVVDLGQSRAALALPALCRYMRRREPFAMLSTLTHANLLALGAKAICRSATRVVVREANTLSVASRESSDLTARVFPILARRLYPSASGIVAVSHGVADDLMSTLRADPSAIHVVYNPLPPDLTERANAPTDGPIDRILDQRCIVAVGRLARQKSIDVLVRAFARIQERVPSHLLLLGEGPERGNLEELARTLGVENRVLMPGFVGNPYPAMRRSALFVLSSSWEGLPNSLLQAMALGAKVVSTDCPSGPREILADGRFGRLSPVGDVEALAANMVAALEEDHRNTPGEWLRYLYPTEPVDQYLRILLP